MMEQAGLTAQIAAADADPWALQQSPVVGRQSPRRLLVFVLTGVLAYCAGLIALIPASAVLPKSDLWQLGGTIWNGEAVLGGTTNVEWRWSPIASLSRLALTVDWHMAGGATDLAGIASPGLRQLRLDSVSGVIDGAMLSLAAPNLPVTCRYLAQVDLGTLVIGGSDQKASGSLRTSPVHCAVKALGSANALAAAAIDLPALHGTIGPAHGVPAGSPVQGLSSGALFTLPSRQHLVEVRLYSTGALSLWPTAALTARIPALGGTRLDTAVNW